MSTGWEKHEPSPIEFFHGRLQDEFHKWRKQVTENTTVEIDGMIFNKIVVEAKKATYEKYQVMNLDKTVLKTDLWNQQRVQKCFDELGFDFPKTEEQLKAFDEKFKDYPHQLTGKEIDPLKIIRECK